MKRKCYKSSPKVKLPARKARRPKQGVANAASNARVAEQVECGSEFMERYREVFEALAKS